MKKFHIDRLEKLYNFLGTVEPKKFDFSSWADTKTGETDMNVCGTTACALGWAGSMPEFRKRGLKLGWEKSYWDSSKVRGEVYLYSDGAIDANGLEAGEKFFGLTEEEAEYLFIPTEDADADTIGYGHMPLTEYRKGLRKFINKKKRKLKVA